MQPGLIQLRMRILIIADSAVIALQRRADDRAESLAAMLDQMNRGRRGVSAALAAPFHFGFFASTGWKHPAVEPGEGDFIALGINVGDCFDLVIDPGVTASGLAKAIAEVNHLPGGQAADDGFHMVDLDLEFGHLAPLFFLTDTVQYGMMCHVVNNKMTALKQTIAPDKKANAIKKGSSTIPFGTPVAWSQCEK